MTLQAISVSVTMFRQRCCYCRRCRLTFMLGCVDCDEVNVDTVAEEIDDKKEGHHDGRGDDGGAVAVVVVVMSAMVKQCSW